MGNPKESITDVTINNNGTDVDPVNPPTGGFGTYETSGHQSVWNNALHVAAIMEANGIGNGRVSGNTNTNNNLPNNPTTARNNQDIFHVHVSNEDADQIFFKWTWNNGALNITTSPPIKHKS